MTCYQNENFAPSLNLLTNAKSGHLFKFNFVINVHLFIFFVMNRLLWNHSKEYLQVWEKLQSCQYLH